MYTKARLSSSASFFSPTCITAVAKASTSRHSGALSGSASNCAIQSLNNGASTAATASSSMAGDLPDARINISVVSSSPNGWLSAVIASNWLAHASSSQTPCRRPSL